MVEARRFEPTGVREREGAAVATAILLEDDNTRVPPGVEPLLLLDSGLKLGLGAGDTEAAATDG